MKIFWFIKFQVYQNGTRSSALIAPIPISADLGFSAFRLIT
ncbi:hypothetical protein D1BOALGB6SA_1694 [Olavius sp. associated proteobacterium Delta 1]|nr:hypothetical protein D1BOALGB6SA_1694 [Olavius sp. associated proteobacterium Delta 1]